MAFIKGGSNLSERVYGLGTDSTYGGFDADGVVPHFKINNKPLRYVKRNATFMPFSQAPAIDGFTVDGFPVFNGNYAEVNRFMIGNTIRHTLSADTNGQVRVYYKGGGTRNSKGTLRIGNTEIPNCPPVILVFGQGGGGNGGDGYYAGYLLVDEWSGGGGGGSGAFWAFFLELPYDTGGEFKEFGFSVLIAAGSVYFANSGINFAFVGRGGDGYSGESGKGHYPGQGGVGGVVSVFSLPSYAYSCCRNASGGLLSYASLAGRGGAWGETDVVFRGDWDAGNVPSDVFSMYINSIGLRFPLGYYAGGSRGRRGGGGGSSRFGQGGSGGPSKDSDGKGGGVGAGGGGGSPLEFAVGTYRRTGGKGGVPYVGFVW